MAHGITSDDYMASGSGIMPWHGLGAVMPERNMTSREAMELAKLDWTIAKWPLYAHYPEASDVNAQLPIKVRNQWALVRNQWALVRTDTEKVFGVVGDNYRPTQNTEAFSFLDDMLMDPNGAYIETAGSLHGGAVVWIMVSLADTIVVADDKIKSYMLLTNRNDGRRAIELSQTNVRVVCANTLSFAETSQSKLMKIRHISGLVNSLDKARQMFDIANENNLAMSAVFNRMAEAAATPEAIAAVLKQLIPGNSLSDNEASKLRTQTFRDRIKYLSVNGKGNAEYAGTWWGVYNGVTEWSDHHKQIARGPATKAATMTPTEVRLVSNWSGPSAQFKSQALNLIVQQMEDSAPVVSAARRLPEFDDKQNRALAKALGLDASGGSLQPKEDVPAPEPKDFSEIVTDLNLDGDTSEMRHKELTALASRIEDAAKSGKRVNCPSWLLKEEFNQLDRAARANYKIKIEFGV